MFFVGLLNHRIRRLGLAFVRCAPMGASLNCAQPRQKEGRWGYQGSSVQLAENVRFLGDLMVIYWWFMAMNFMVIFCGDEFYGDSMGFSGDVFLIGNGVII